VQQFVFRNWSDEEISKVRAMAADDKSSYDIAEATGRSRNSIIGMCNRKNIKLNGKAHYKTRIKRKIVFSEPKEVIYFPDENQKPINLLEIKEGQCRWLIGDAKRMLCCGRKTNKTYCIKHDKKAHVLNK
jgi:hypothetical protein